MSESAAIPTTPASNPHVNTPEVPDRRILIAAVIGFGLLLGSVWLVRWKGVFDTSLTLPGIHVTSLVTCLILAFSASGFKAWSRSTLALIGILLALDVGTMLLVQLVPMDEQVRLVVGIGSVAFEGIASALASVLFLLAIARFSPNLSLGAVVVALLLGNLYRLAFVSSDLVIWAQTAAKLLALAALAYLVRGLGNQGAAPDAQAAKEAAEPAPARPWLPWALPVIAAMAPLMLLRGVFSEMSGLYGIGISSFVNIAVEVLVIWTRLVMLALCLFARRFVTRRTLVLGSLALWAASVVLGLTAQNGNGPFLASAALEVCFTAAQTLLLALAVRHAHEEPADAVPVVAVMLALTELTHVGKLLWSLAPSSPDEGAMLFAAVSALALLAIVAALTALAARAGNRSAATGSDETPAGSTDAPAPSPLVAEELHFWTRFEALCSERGLTERETQILQQALHGYTIGRIAENLSLSVETVKTYLTRAYGRLGTSGKQGAIELLDASANS